MAEPSADALKVEEVSSSLDRIVIISVTLVTECLPTRLTG